MLEMVVRYHLGYCFRNGAPKEAQSGKWSLSLDPYPWENQGYFTAPLVGLNKSFPRPFMQQTCVARGKHNHTRAL